MAKCMFSIYKHLKSSQMQQFSVHLIPSCLTKSFICIYCMKIFTAIIVIKLCLIQFDVLYKINFLKVKFYCMLQLKQDLFDYFQVGSLCIDVVDNELKRFDQWREEMDKKKSANILYSRKQLSCILFIFRCKFPFYSAKKIFQFILNAIIQ